MTVLKLHEYLDEGRFEKLIELQDELSESLLVGYDNVGVTAIGKIIDAEKIEYLPKELLTERVLLAEAKHEADYDDGNTTDTGEETWSALDRMISNHQFHLVPNALKTKSILMRPQSGGWTPLHVAATFGKLNQMPKDLITLENLRVTNDLGTNCFHLAALNDNLRQIPKCLITVEVLLEADEDKISPLEYAFQKNKEQLLGLALDERCRPTIGDFLDTVMQLQTVAKQHDTDVEIDIF